MQNQAYLMMAMAGGGALYLTAGMSRKKFMGWLIDHKIDFAWIDEALLDEPPGDRDRQLAIKRAPIAGLPPQLHVELERRFDLQARDWYASTETSNGFFAPWDRPDLVGIATLGHLFPPARPRSSTPTSTRCRSVSPASCACAVRA